MEMDNDRISPTGAPPACEPRPMAPIAGVLLWIALAMPALAQTLPPRAADVLPGAREAGAGHSVTWGCGSTTQSFGRPDRASTPRRPTRWASATRATSRA